MVVVFVPLVTSSVYLSPDILDNQKRELGQIYRPNNRFWIPRAFWRSKFENNVNRIWCKKMVVKWPLIPIFDQGLISRVFQYTPNFLRQPERIWQAEGSESKGAGTHQRKRNKYGTKIAKKCTKIKIFYIFCLILRNSLCQVKKVALLANRHE